MSGEPIIELDEIADEQVSLLGTDSGEYFIGDSGSYASLTSEDSLQAAQVGTAPEPNQDMAAELAYLDLGADAPSITEGAGYGPTYRRQG